MDKRNHKLLVDSILTIRNKYYRIYKVIKENF